MKDFAKKEESEETDKIEKKGKSFKILKEITRERKYYPGETIILSDKKEIGKLLTNKIIK